LVLLTKVPCLGLYDYNEHYVQMFINSIYIYIYIYILGFTYSLNGNFIHLATKKKPYNIQKKLFENIDFLEAYIN
jgi:hypothetical protein